MKQTILPPPPSSAPKRRHPRAQHWCDCGRKAVYQHRVVLYRADLKTEVHAIIYLCENCFMLECDLQLGRGNKPPKATRIG